MKRSVGSVVVNFVGLLLLAIVMTGVVVALTRRPGHAGAKDGGKGADGTPTPTVEVNLSEFRVAVSQFNSVSSGRVNFVVRNAGTTDHEMIVLKTDAPFDKLSIVDDGDPPVPVKTGAHKIDEDSSVGETGGEDLKPGEMRRFTLKNLVPGKYVLACNLADHYGLGMRSPFTVN